MATLTFPLRPRSVIAVRLSNRPLRTSKPSRILRLGCIDKLLAQQAAALQFARGAFEPAGDIDGVAQNRKLQPIICPDITHHNRSVMHTD